MQLKQIKEGRVYVTKKGLVGRCTRKGGTFPVTVELEVVFPLSTRALLRPGEVDREASRAEVPEQYHTKLFPETNKP